MAMKWGNCQTKRMAKRATAGHSMTPRAAVQPMSAGSCSGEGSDEGVERGDALERRVDRYVADRGEQGQHAGDGIGGAA